MAAFLSWLKQEVVNSNSLCFYFCLKTNCDFVIRVFPVNQGILLTNKSQCIWNTLRRKATMQKIGQLVRPARASIIIDLRFSEQDSRNSLLQTGNITNSCLQNIPPFLRTLWFIPLIWNQSLKSCHGILLESILNWAVQQFIRGYVLPFSLFPFP